MKDFGEAFSGGRQNCVMFSSRETFLGGFVLGYRTFFVSGFSIIGLTTIWRHLHFPVTKIAE